MSDVLFLLLPYVVSASHIILILLVIIALFKNSFGRSLAELIGKYALSLVFFVSLAAIAGSLFYSEIIGFEPCVLCWWQRSFIYPLPIISYIALWKNDRQVFSYTIALSLIASIVSIYQYYAVSLGGASIFSCTSVGGDCTTIYINAFGYITIPLMSLTISLYILLLSWFGIVYKNLNEQI